MLSRRRPIKHIKAQLRLDMPKKGEYNPVQLQSDDPRLLTAQRLHARVYEHLNYIFPEDIGDNGAMHLKSDPHQAHSDYFVITDPADHSQVLVTARQIRAVDGHNDLPVLKNARIKKKHKKRLLAQPHEHMVEISGLVKDKGVSTLATIELYRMMWQYSVKNDGHVMWLMACEPRLYKKLKVMFGRSVKKVGRRTKYQGGDIIPCIIDLSASERALKRHRKSRHPIYRGARRKIADHFLKDLEQQL